MGPRLNMKNVNIYTESDENEDVDDEPRLDPESVEVGNITEKNLDKFIGLFLKRTLGREILKIFQTLVINIHDNVGPQNYYIGFDHGREEGYSAGYKHGARDAKEKFGSMPSLSRKEKLAAIWDKTGGKCSYCGVLLNPFRTLEIDHIVARANGGTNNIINLVPSCQDCNRAKGDKDLEDFRFYFEKKMLRKP